MGVKDYVYKVKWPYDPSCTALQSCARNGYKFPSFLIKSYEKDTHWFWVQEN